MNDIELLRQAVLDAADRGDVLTRETLERVYLAELLAIGRIEPEALSKAWIDRLWAKVGKADLDGVSRKARHPDQFFSALAPLVGAP